MPHGSVASRSTSNDPEQDDVVACASGMRASQRRYATVDASRRISSRRSCSRGVSGTSRAYLRRIEIGFTASAFADDVARCKAAGMDLVLHKPLVRAQLEEALYLCLSPVRDEVPA